MPLEPRDATGHDTPAARDDHDTPAARDGSGAHAARNGSGAAAPPLAITGMAGRFPGADDGAALWQNLVQARDGVREVPSERWDLARYYSPRFEAAGKAHSRWGGFLDDIARFDAACFGISPREAAHMDPQQRLLLEEVWHCLEDAGVGAGELEARRTGVFVGVMAIDYHQNATGDLERVSGYTGAGNYACMLANRISHHFGLGGPSQTLDAACASSLVALHEARKALASGECRHALVGAANLAFNPYKYVAFSKARMLSPNGRCRTFDAAADGYVPGEGVAAVLLEPLADALARGRRVRAVLLGSAVNHNGGGASLTAPSVEAQVELIEAACRSAGVSPASLTYVEAHGTGTTLGDPIELSALARVLRRAGAARGQCRVGSIKSNIGHLEAAAGLAGLFKLVAMLERRAFVPTLHVERENPLLGLDGSPCALSRRYEPWPAPAGAPRRAGLSSFGFGGVNAHVVLEEAPAPVSPAPSAAALPVVISAQSKDALARLLVRYERWCRGPAFARASLEAIATTALRGRRPLPARVAVVVDTKEELAAALEQLDVERDAVIAEREPELELCVEGAVPPEALARVLERLGCRPRRVCGVGAGVAAALALAGCVSLEAAGALGAADDADRARLAGELRPPRLPLFDPVERRWVRPPAVDLARLLDAAATCGVALEPLLALYDGLCEHQFTFKKLLDEWQAPLAERAVSVPTLVARAKAGAAALPAGEALLLAVLLGSCLERLHRRWGLEHRGPQSPAVRALTELVLAGALAPRDAVALLLGDASERASAVSALAARLETFAAANDGSWSEWTAAPDWGPARLGAAAWLSAVCSGARAAPPEGSGTRLVVRAEPATAASQGPRSAEQPIATASGATLELAWSGSEPVPRALARVAAALWTRGHAVDLRGLMPPGHPRCELPSYPFGGERHWLPLAGAPSTAGAEPERHRGARELQSDLPIVREHVIAGHAIAPGALLLGALLGLDGGEPRAALERVLFQAPAFAEPRCPLVVVSDGERLRIAPEGNPLCSARSAQHARAGAAAAARARWGASDGDPIDVGWLYTRFAELGYAYGPRLRVLGELRCRRERAGAGWALAEIEARGDSSPLERFTRVVDGAFQAVLGAWLVTEPRAATLPGGAGLFLPCTIERVERYAELGERCVVEVEPLPSRSPQRLVARLTIRDRDGRPLLRLEQVGFQWASGAFEGSAGAHARRAAAESAAAADAPVESAAAPDAQAASPPASASAAHEPARLYCPAWTARDGAARPLPRRVVIAAPDSALAERLEAMLGEQRCRVWRVADARPELVARALVDAAASAPADGCGEPGRAAHQAEPVGLLWLTPYFAPHVDTSDGARVAALVEREGFALLELLRDAQRAPVRGRVRAVVLTQGALDAGREVTSRDGRWALAGLTGLARAALAESPALDVRTLDADGGDAAAAVLAALSAPERGGCFALRDGRLSIAGLRPLAAPPSAWTARAGGAYVVVGGAGGVGLKLLAWLAEAGARRLAVVARSPLDPERRARLEALEQGGVSIDYVRADVADAAALERALAALRARHGRIRGVIHAGGVLEDRLLVNKDLASFRRVLAPKLLGAVHLDRLTAADELDCFVAFSSVVALLGNVGQADYACANGSLDAFIAWRRRRRPEQRSVSIAWTVFEGEGMAAAALARRQLARLGLTPLAEPAARLAFHRALAAGVPSVAVFATAAPRTTFLQIAQQEPVAEHTSSSGARRMVTLLDEERPAPRGRAEGRVDRSAIVAHIREALAQALAVPSDSFDEEVTLDEYGLNSLSIMEVAGQLELHYGEAIHHSALIEHPTIARLSAHLVEQLEARGGAAGAPEPALAARDAVPTAAPAPSAISSPAASRAPAPSASERDVPIAILARACRVPGARDLEGFWQNLRAGRVSTGPIPSGRFRTLGRALRYPERAGFIEDIEGFAAAHFGLSVEEAAAMDPQQRIFLELGQELFDAAGYEREEIEGRAVGVFIGAHENDYARWVPGRARYAGKAGVVNVIGNMIAGRLANEFDLRGPAQTLFTACSSSLVAVHEACKKLAHGECELAIAGGVELLLDDAWFIGFEAAGVLSSDGVCRVFDKKANGFVLGEAAGAVLLKPLERALADGDPIAAVVLASATNNDGATMGLTTPSLAAQKALMQTVFRRAGGVASRIGYYEAHGTGTQLGDPIEVKAATESLRLGGEGRGYCALGSVKANLGHSLSAAGISSLLKASLLVERGEIVPTVNCAEPRFDFTSSPFFIPSSPSPWRVPGERLAAVSAFGFGGTNCHVVLAEAPREHRASRRPLPPRALERVRCWIDVPDAPASEEPDAPAPPRAARGPLSPELCELLAELGAGRLAPARARELIRIGGRA